jgi:hypothetical protein
MITHRPLLIFLLLVTFFEVGSVEAQSEKEDDPMSVLGEAVWTRLRPGWSLTVNDQCLYEFVFQFEHDPNLPIGDPEFLGTCHFGETSDDPPEKAPDGKLYLEPRQMWERFPDYVWATIGFNHLSVDWHPCGHRPRGYSIAHYDFSVRLMSRQHFFILSSEPLVVELIYCCPWIAVLSCYTRISCPSNAM